MKAARSEAEAESPLPEPETTGFSPCVVHSAGKAIGHSKNKICPFYFEGELQ
jgi:hypothetical protein